MTTSPSEKPAAAGTATEPDASVQWAIVDVLGHNRHVGMLDEFTFAGFAFVRVRVPDHAGTIVPHLIGPSSVYMITPITEERAKRMLGLDEPKTLHIEQREDFMLEPVDPDDIGDDSSECWSGDSDDESADPDDQPTDNFDALIP